MSPTTIIPEVNINGSLGSKLKRYPAKAGTGNEINDEKVVVTESIFALAFGSTISISFVKKVLDTEKTEA